MFCRLCEFSNARLKRFHASCLWCRMRKYANGKIKAPLWSFNSQAFAVLPQSFYIVEVYFCLNCTWLCYVNVNRRLANVKDAAIKCLLKTLPCLHKKEVGKYVCTLIEMLA